MKCQALAGVHVDFLGKASSLFGRARHEVQRHSVGPPESNLVRVLLGSEENRTT